MLVSPKSTDLNDDISDLFGGPTVVAPAPRVLPQDEASVRIRETTPEFAETCPKCRGRGQFVGYSGRVFGQCFTCKGKGKRTFKTSPETRANAAQKRAAVPVNNWNAFVEKFSAEATILIEGSAQTFGDGRWNQTCSDIKAKIEKFGDLSEGTMAMLGRAVARKAERAAQKAAQASQKPANDQYPNIRAAFDLVVAKGAKRAQMTFDGINISLASMTGNNPGALYVKNNGEYAGKIVGTTFKGGYNAPATIMMFLDKIEADPQGAIKAEAEKTAKRLLEAEAKGEKISLPCGCCGIELTDPVSIRRGIGPICAAKWGF